MNIKQLYIILRFININRYRLFSYKDYSKPFVILFFYVLALVNLWKSESVYSLYILFFLLFLQCLYIQNRNDFEFLSKHLNYYNIIIIYFIDLFILNIPILLIISTKSLELMIYSFIIVLISSFLYKNFSVKKIPLPFLKTDPIWISPFRKNSAIFLVLILLYYITYQGLINYNYNLVIFSIIGILFFILSVINIREEIIFLKLSKLTIEMYLFKITIISLINSFILFIPIIMLLIIMGEINFKICFLYLFSAIILVNLKYVFFNKKITQSIVSSFYIFFISYLFNQNISIIEYIIMIILLFLIHYISVNKLKTILDNINI